MSESSVTLNSKNEYVTYLKCCDVETSTHIVEILATKKHRMINEVEKLVIDLANLDHSGICKILTRVKLRK